MTKTYDSTAIRRELHPLAELGFDLEKTSGYVLSKLRGLGIEANKVGLTNGVLGIIRGSEPGPVMLLRADMDALPFKNPDGTTVAVHACGHDAHAAMLLEAASRLVGKVKKGTLKLLFQPAEENFGGAPAMIKAGVIDDVDIAVGAHIRPIQDLPAGKMCASVEHNGFAFPVVRVKGRAAHGSRPHLGVNALEAAVGIVNAVNAIRMTPDVHWTIVPTRMVADGAMNIIPQSCLMQFDVRAKTQDVLEALLAKFELAVKHAALAFGAEAEISYEGGLGPAPRYDPEIEREIAECIEELGEGTLAPNCGGGGEDFHFFTKAKKSLRAGYYGVGVGAEPGLHDRTMHFDDTLLPMGAAVFVKMALRHLG